ncbi:MAG: hypothetical protein MUP55_00720, partial [Candidatus Aenigmarchaeota archaeon]|nr:hypothetical protein [Candidatus Aenigmarchaeota archaeon]
MTGNYFIAKKQYVCSTCGTCIVIGERYYYQTTRGQSIKNYKYHYCMKCRQQNVQLHNEGYTTFESKEKVMKCSELVKKYGAMDAKELVELVNHSGSMINLARMVNKHYREIKFERFKGSCHGTREGRYDGRRCAGGEKMRVKGTVIILFVDRNEMYRILKQRFNIMKISQILPRSAKWRHYNLLCMVEPNVIDKGVVAYVGKVYDYHNEMVYQINGSVRYPWQRVVGLDVLADMVEWCFKNVHHGSIINIYTSDLDGVVRRDVHDFVSPSIILRDTLVMKLKWFA